MATIEFQSTDINPRRAEKRRALVASITDPLFLIAHSWKFFWFVLRYAKNRIGRRFARDIHKIGKKQPAWLDDPGLALSASDSDDELTFPSYQPSDTRDHSFSSTVTVFENEPGDIESYLAKHRWHSCQVALVADDDTVRSAVLQCVEWLRVPLPRSDLAWEPYSTSERVANLVVLLAARPAARQYISDKVLRQFLDDSLQWIDAHLEYYGPRQTNNHILNDARALVIAGAVLKNEMAVEKGLLLFSRMGRDLFQAGGFLRERSFHYQIVVMNWLLDTLHFGRFASAASPSAQRSIRTLEVLAPKVAQATSLLLSHLKGCDTFIGDLSPDSPPGLSRARIDRLYSQWMQPGSTVQNERIDDWIFLSRIDHSIVACTIAHTFPVKFPTHGHSDIGHFVWRWQDVCVLADAGRARYTKDACSLAQADARGHNVILINGLGPLAESLAEGGHWHLQPYSNATVETRVNAAGSFTVKHDGFRRLRDVGVHSRTIGVIDHGVAVEDSIGGNGTVTLDMLWHFSPLLSPVSEHTTEVTGKGIVVSCSSESLEGGTPDLQWQTYSHSSAYGDVTRAPLLRLRWVVALPCTIRTTMSVSQCAA